MPNIRKLLGWYDNSARDLPWRRTSDPYKVWLSEVILQQTRVEQGLNYYLAFTKRFPNVFELAAAHQDEVLKLWQGLGYYSRARNLHHAAKTIVEKYDGLFPSTYKSILELRGIGPYTAAAIASIVFNESVPVVDGNVMRVVSRWFGIEDAINSSSGKKKIEEALLVLIDSRNPGKFNQAMMEFGALYCKPKNPNCGNCIFKDQCIAFQTNRVSALPYKISKIIIKARYFNYLFICHAVKTQKFTFIKKRTSSDIWEGLYEFPLIETSEDFSMEQLMNTIDWKQMTGENKPVVGFISKTYPHQLTHQRIFARFIVIEIENLLAFPENMFMKIELSELHKFPIPRLIDKFLLDYIKF